MPRGAKYGGRKKGTPNKVTATVKEGFKLAYDMLGGPEALAEWGRENRTEFYKLASKLIPTEIQPLDSTGKPSDGFVIAINHVHVKTDKP